MENSGCKKNNHVNGVDNTAHGARVYNNILEAIGNTPLVRLNRIPQEYGLHCEIYAKCEFMNPGGSLKDRIVVAMMEEAERGGRLHADSVFVEPTSGNTGIGTSMCAAVKGYKSIIVTPDKNSNEKMDTMRILGTKVIQTPSLLPWNDPGNYIMVAKKIVQENPNAVSMDQYTNAWNPNSHYESTAVEILEALGNKLDMFVMGTGTGGTLTGVARRLREVCPSCKIVAVDPKGSLVYPDAGQKVYKGFFVEGIGGDYVPEVLDKHIADFVEKPTDIEAFNMSRELIRKEGLLCGGSSGSLMVSAIKEAKKLSLGPGARVVVMLPDGIRNYMTKFVSDQWMEAHLFMDPPKHTFPWWEKLVSTVETVKVPQVSEEDSVRVALKRMGAEHSAAIVVDDSNHYVGAISKDSIRHNATNPKTDQPLNFSDPVKTHLIKDSLKLVENAPGATLGRLARMLDVASLVVIVQCTASMDGPFVPKGIITSEVLLKVIVDQTDK